MGKRKKQNNAGENDPLLLPRPPCRRLGRHRGAGARKRRLPQHAELPRVRQPRRRRRDRQCRRVCWDWWPSRWCLPQYHGFLHALLGWRWRRWEHGGGRARRVCRDWRSSRWRLPQYHGFLHALLGWRWCRWEHGGGRFLILQEIVLLSCLLNQLAFRCHATIMTHNGGCKYSSSHALVASRVEPNY